MDMEIRRNSNINKTNDWKIEGFSIKMKTTKKISGIKYFIKLIQTYL
jgi:hypothetical protein